MPDLASPTASNVHTYSLLQVGQRYTAALKQMGEHGRNPWVSIRFSHLDVVGKVQTEVVAADGKVYMSVRFPNVGGAFLFRMDSPEELTPLPGMTRVSLTLFAIL
jgi:hypothetical protein